MDKICAFCGAYFFFAERTGGTNAFPRFGKKCCSNGASCIEPFPPLPLDLLSFFESNNHFKNNILSYNNACTFASLSCSHPPAPSGRGPPSFVIQGNVYINIGDLLPPENAQPAFAQLLFLDPQAAARSAIATRGRRRGPADDTLREGLLRSLMDLLRTNNHYAHWFMRAKEVHDRARPGTIKPVALVFRGPQGEGGSHPYAQPTGKYLLSPSS